MKYLILMFGSQRDYDAMAGSAGAGEPAWSAADVAAMGAFMESFGQDLAESGELVDAQGLTAPVHTRRIRLRGGAPVVTDGPYAETEEVLAGYWLVDCDSFDRATEIAGRPGALTMGRTDAEDLLRQLAPQVLGALVRRYGHFDTAEDAVQEALLAAATQWPAEGLPGNPRGWLITVASRRLTDLLRSEQARQRREDTVARRVLPEQWVAPAADAAGRDAVDDTLVLLFLCCHPALSPASQIALTLRAVGGLT